MRLTYIVSQKLGAWSGEDSSRAEEIVAALNSTLRKSGRNVSYDKVKEELDAKVKQEQQERYKLEIEESWLKG